LERNRDFEENRTILAVGGAELKLEMATEYWLNCQSDRSEKTNSASADMAEGEELGSNLLRVDQRSASNGVKGPEGQAPMQAADQCGPNRSPAFQLRVAVSDRRQLASAPSWHNGMIVFQRTSRPAATNFAAGAQAAFEKLENDFNARERTERAARVGLVVGMSPPCPRQHRPCFAGEPAQAGGRLSK
jgi:hypothetical protein